MVIRDRLTLNGAGNQASLHLTAHAHVQHQRGQRCNHQRGAHGAVVRLILAAHLLDTNRQRTHLAGGEDRGQQQLVPHLQEHEDSRSRNGGDHHGQDDGEGGAVNAAAVDAGSLFHLQCIFHCVS